MKTPPNLGAAFRREGAFTLVEVLVYMSVLTVVMGLAFSAFYQCQTNSAHLQRNAQQIARVIRAGEQWRKDIRQSTGVLFQQQDGKPLVRLPSSTGEAAYLFNGSNVLRRLPGKENWVIFLERVKNSEMRVDQRKNISVCSWELELLPAKANSRVKPLFSFMAVSGRNAK